MKVQKDIQQNDQQDEPCLKVSKVIVKHGFTYVGWDVVGMGIDVMGTKWGLDEVMETEKEWADELVPMQLSILKQLTMHNNICATRVFKLQQKDKTWPNIFMPNSTNPMSSR